MEGWGIDSTVQEEKNYRVTELINGIKQKKSWGNQRDVGEIQSNKGKNEKSV
jgi:hypothetical protein